MLCVLTEQKNGKSPLQQAQDEVEEVKVIMMDTMNKADERSGKLHELEDRADLLLEKGKRFEKTTAKVEKKKRWENKKLKVVVISIGVVAALVIVGLIIFAIVDALVPKN
uniref:V-SNARE coiled-coil homology domain-containing protein n=1 Tax=Monopterus albus TaxID=43700 RepID=A0A3Q3IJS0_MONAL